MSSPKAAWLKKRTCTMGRSRWQARFFVLLETELRYYTDEYAVTPNYIWNLRDIVDIKQYKATHCLCFESRPMSIHHSKPLMLQFPSAIEMKEWLEHLVQRCALSPPTRSSSLVRRRGIILSSLAIHINEDEDEHPPSLESTVSASSSSSSIATLVDQEPSLPSSLPTKPIDETTSPTYLKYKSQFHLQI